MLSPFVNSKKTLIKNSPRIKSKIDKGSTPKPNSSNKPSSTSVNESPIAMARTRDCGTSTPVYLDLNYHLTALTDKCISLEKSLIDRVNLDETTEIPLKNLKHLIVFIQLFLNRN